MIQETLLSPIICKVFLLSVVNLTSELIISLEIPTTLIALVLIVKSLIMTTKLTAHGWRCYFTIRK